MRFIYKSLLSLLLVCLAASSTVAVGAERGTPREAKALLQEAVALVKAEGAEKALAQYGMSFGEFAILWYLSGLKEEINLSQVKRSTFLYSGANITKVTEKLVQKAYINRRENPMSRREKLVKITPIGAKFFSTASGNS